MARTVADVCLGLVLFLAFVTAVGSLERHASATHRLGGLLSVSASAGDLFKFTIDDSPFIAAAMVATAIPVPQGAGYSAARQQPDKKIALPLLGLVFAGIVAFNLAFYRHLRREYASPR